MYRRQRIMTKHISHHQIFVNRVGIGKSTSILKDWKPYNVEPEGEYVNQIENFSFFRKSLYQLIKIGYAAALRNN